MFLFVKSSRRPKLTEVTEDEVREMGREAGWPEN